MLRLVVAVCGLLFVAGPAVAADLRFEWPHWRGPEANGVCREKNLPERWSPDGENLVWKNESLASRSTPIIMRNRMYLLMRHQPATLQEAEKVVCVDTATGNVIWESVFNAFLTDVPDTRVGWSSIIGDPETGHVFALGVCGLFQCLNGETGEVLWSRSMSEEFGMLTTYGGRTNFPIVFENLAIIGGVFINYGELARPAHRVMALDKRNGQTVWFTSTRPLPEDTIYATPALGVVDGQAQLAIASGDGSVYGVQPRTGKVLWNYDVSPRGINTSPIFANNAVICGHSEENLDDTRMGALFAVDATKTGNLTKTGELWRNKEQYIGKCSPLVVGDRVYAIDDGGIFFVVDRLTGSLIGKTKIGTMGRASPVYADGKIYAVDATGRWFTFALDAAKGLKPVFNQRLNVEVNASPVISRGRIFLVTETGTYCIGLPDVTPECDPIPTLDGETSGQADTTPANIVLTPAESLLKPGQKQRLSVYVYNAKGQYLSTAAASDVKFTVSGAGSVDEQGRFMAPDAAAHVATGITAELAGHKAQARVRIVPAAPWNFEFTGGQIPVSPVGLRYRHVGLDFTLREALRAEMPLAARCYIFLTTQFTNLDRPALKIDDSTPQQALTGFRRYLGVIEQTTTLADAQSVLNPALEILKREGVLGEVKWNQDEKVGMQLMVTRGPRKVDGEGVMCKITTIPKGTRSQGWLGHTDMSHYTIQAEALAAAVEVGAGDANSKTPDIGLINQRYRFEMMGAGQQLKLYSWYPHDQKYHSVPFPWSTETWYRLKFIVDTETKEGQLVSHLKGKAWKRDEPEPEAWSIEWTDSPGNASGSPGLAGNAKDAEIFIDNVKVEAR